MCALGGLDLDTMIASYLVDATRSTYPLEELALEHTAYKALTRRRRLRQGRQGAVARRHPGGSGRSTSRASAPISPASSRRFSAALLDKEQLADVYRSLELPLIPVLMAIEQAGVRIDTAALAVQSRQVDVELNRLMKQIFELAGGEFNINSPKQLAEVLFDRLGLPVLKRTGTSKAPSTAVEVLEELALTHELPRLILDWRGMMKLKGTYIDALPHARQSRHRSRAHQLQPGGRRDRPPEQQRSRTCRTSRSARSSDARSAAPSSPIRATS